MLHLGPRHFKCSVNTLNITLYFNQNYKTVFGSLNYFDLDSGIKTELIKKRSRKIHNTAPSSGMSSRHTVHTLPVHVSNDDASSHQPFIYLPQEHWF